MRTKLQRPLSKIDGADPSHRWAVILAGGNGARLLSLTRRIVGDDRPKQFCAIVDGETLIEQTRRRVRRTVPPEQILIALTKTHQHFYAGPVAGTEPSRLVVQPFDRGTAPAILYSLMRLRELDRSAVVTFFPSDHYFANDEAFTAQVDSAFGAAESYPGLVVLLGIPPTGPEVGFGWIEPGEPLAASPAGPICSVRRFWEKPPLALANVLLRRGCLWNTFIMAGRVDSFLTLLQSALPDLLHPFEAIRPTFLNPDEEEAVLDLYSGIPSVDFSGEVLRALPDGLGVLRGEKLGWTDLGEARRVLALFERKGIATEWATGCVARSAAS